MLRFEVCWSFQDDELAGEKVAGSFVVPAYEDLPLSVFATAGEAAVSDVAGATLYMTPVYPYRSR